MFNGVVASVVIKIVFIILTSIPIKFDIAIVNVAQELSYEGKAGRTIYLIP